MKHLSVVAPTFHCKDLALIFVKSFEYFKPDDLTINYIIVENSQDISYKEDVIDLAPKVTWINNDITLVGSEANASGVEKGLKYVDDDWVFIAHCDVCVVNQLFYTDMFKKIDEGYKLIGTVLDPSKLRINAIHISGFMMEYEIAKRINYYPRKLEDGTFFDVGDEATSYCRKNNVKNYCFRNTFNNPALIDLIDDKYKPVYCDRCINDDNEVIFIHLGRGIPKTDKTYTKLGKTSLEGWKEFCYGEIIND